MIQPLRAAHRCAFVTLAVVLPAILLIGLGARRSRPDLSAHFAGLPPTAYLVRESSNLWPKHAIQSKFYSKPDRLQDIYVVLQAAQELNEPDLLLYWTPSAARGDALPGEAVLVGALTTGKAFLLPLNEKRAGYFVLFSPAHQAVYDTATVEKLP